VLGNEPDESQQTIRCPPPDTAHGSEARAWLNALEEQALALGALENVPGARIRATSFELALCESVTVRCSSASASLCADLRGYCCATQADRRFGLGAHARAHRQARDATRRVGPRTRGARHQTDVAHRARRGTSTILRASRTSATRPTRCCASRSPRRTAPPRRSLPTTTTTSTTSTNCRKTLSASASQPRSRLRQPPRAPRLSSRSRSPPPLPPRRQSRRRWPPRSQSRHSRFGAFEFGENDVLSFVGQRRQAKGVVDQAARRREA
jgi:hypothetical protein